MTDDRLPGDDRAERAFGRAFREHEHDHDFEALDADDLIGRAQAAEIAGTLPEEPGRGRRPRWVTLAAAAVALVIAVPVVGAMLAQRGAPSADRPMMATPAGAPELDTRTGAGVAPASDASGESAASALTCPDRSEGGRSTGNPLSQARAVTQALACQYDDEGSLVGATRLSDADAQNLADAIGSTPATVPDVVPSCTTTDAELVVVFDSGSEARLPLDGCRHLAWDDGTSLYEATRATCADLLADPARPEFRDEAMAAACAP